jgi:hypothetical protein
MGMKFASVELAWRLYKYIANGYLACLCIDLEECDTLIFVPCFVVLGCLFLESHGTFSLVRFA